MTVISDLLRHLREVRRTTILTLRTVRDDQLAEPVGPERPSDARSRILNLAEDDDRRRVAVAEILSTLDWRPTEVHRILAVTAQTRGQLRGLLVPVTDTQLDAVPAPGEWAVRQALLHLRNNEARLASDARYAVARLRSAHPLPVERPGIPRAAGTVGEDVPGGLEQVLSAVEQARDDLIAAVADFGPDELSAPTVWAGLEVDVRYMLYRRALHERQHMAQIAKTLQAIDAQPSEAAMLLAEAEVARGALEGLVLGLTDNLVTREPGNGLPSIARLLIEAAVQEAEKVATIHAALA